MSLRTSALGVFAAVTLTAFSIAVVSALPDSATMRFGNLELGSGLNNPPVSFHDNSFRAQDTIFPGSVVIAAGGSVDFEIEGFHQVAIYEPGVAPRDIEIVGTPPFVNDPDGRVFLGGMSDEQVTFDEPGKYLVICNVAPHFEEASMWGWVMVK
jgi:plastocyanin